MDAFTENATESQIKSLIKKIVSSMFCGDFENDVKNFNNPVVLFGGDISSDFSISEFFYKDFINQWKKIERKSYKEKQQLIKDQLDQSKIELDRLIQEYSHWDEITEEWKNKKGAYLKKPLEDYKSLPKKILKAISEKRHLEASISEKKGLISTLSMTLTKKMPTEQNKIFAILGNHEYWDFDNYDDCVSSYSKMFEENKIVFLNSEIARIDAQNGYEKSQIYENKCINRKWIGDYYFVFSDVIIVGGTGFAAQNHLFNAKQGLYRNSIDNEQEKELGKKWNNVFQKACKIAEERNATLIVLTHNPVSDWLTKYEKLKNIVFINGHTHRNEFSREENDVFILSDAQVGYHGKNFILKKVLVHKSCNPFVADKDGFREISIEEYAEFNYFVGKSIRMKRLLKQMSEDERKLYVIKYNDYYGFFVVSSNSVYICNGGVAKKIGKKGDIERYYSIFSSMINKYKEVLMPLRMTQEKISEFVKKFGGSGKIHGSIIDIDFYDHIMINPIDKSITFYYSPTIGKIMRYPDLMLLLHERCPSLEKQYLLLGSSMELPETRNEIFQVYFEKIKVKDSVYSISRRVDVLQKIFDSHILRDWDENILKNEIKNDALQIE